MLRRLPWAICCALFVCLVPSSASWAGTGSQPSSVSSWQSGTSFSGWAVEDPAPPPPDGPADLPGATGTEPDPAPAPADPSPTPDPGTSPEPPITSTEPAPSEPTATETVTVTPAPEPAPEPTMTTMGAGTAEDPMIVTLDTESMAAILLALLLTVLCLGAMTVRSFMPGGD